MKQPIRLQHTIHVDPLELQDLVLRAIRAHYGEQVEPVGWTYHFAPPHDSLSESSGPFSGITVTLEGLNRDTPQ